MTQRCIYWAGLVAPWVRFLHSSLDLGCPKTHHDYLRRRYCLIRLHDVNYTSHEVQDWFALEDRLIADFCDRENQVEQLRRQRVWTRSIQNSPDRKPVSF